MHRGRGAQARGHRFTGTQIETAQTQICLLYTSDAADDLLCVDLGGRRLIKKKKIHTNLPYYTLHTDNDANSRVSNHTTLLYLAPSYNH